MSLENYQLLDIALDETWSVDWNARKVDVKVKNGNYFWAFNVKVDLTFESVELAPSPEDTGLGGTKLRVTWKAMVGLRKDSYENLFNLEQLQSIYAKRMKVLQGFFANLDRK